MIVFEYLYDMMDVFGPEMDDFDGDYEEEDEVMSYNICRFLQLKMIKYSVSRNIMRTMNLRALLPVL